MSLMELLQMTLLYTRRPPLCETPCYPIGVKDPNRAAWHGPWMEVYCATWPRRRIWRFSAFPDPLKDPKKRNPLIIPLFPQCNNGFILGGSFRGSGLGF